MGEVGVWGELCTLCAGNVAISDTVATQPADGGALFISPPHLDTVTLWPAPFDSIRSLRPHITSGIRSDPKFLIQADFVGA
jgi:hypothetical protein